MKKVVIVLTIILLVIVGFISVGLFLGEMQDKTLSQYETETLELGTIYRKVEADGVVTSNQTSLLFWKISGEVANVNVQTGYKVDTGTKLASIDPNSTPAYLIIAQIEKITAETALNLLLNSQLQQTQALNALDKAQKRLDDALHPEEIQAEALKKVALAQETVDDAQRNYEIASAVPTQADIDAAYSNMLLAENRIKETEDQIDKLNSTSIRIGVNQVGGRRMELDQEQINDIQSDITKGIKQLELLLSQQRYQYEKLKDRYNKLLQPPNPADIKLAESDLALAKAELSDAEKEWERIKGGTSLGDLAVYEAQVADAQREWERVKDGPNPDDVSIYEARIAAAEATLKDTEILAPFDGTVTAIHTKPNDLVEPGSTAFQIDDLTHLYASLNVTEIDISLLDIGQSVILTFDSAPGAEYHGKITEIGIVGTKLLGASSFKVKAEILDPDENIRLGMTTSAEIIIKEMDDVLMVPNQAISGLDGNIVIYKLSTEPKGSLIPLFTWERNSIDSSFKFPLTPQNSVKISISAIPIELGIKSGTNSEILSGELAPGDKIIFDPPEDILN